MLLLLLQLACTPSCEDVCRHIVDCENAGTERMPAEECEEMCQQQAKLYDEWTDTQKRDAFDAELVCIRNASCDELEEGVCYDEEVWSY